MQISPFSDIKVLQRSVATQLRCGGIFNEHYVTHSLYINISEDVDESSLLLCGENSVAVSILWSQSTLLPVLLTSLMTIPLSKMATITA